MKTNEQAMERVNGGWKGGGHVREREGGRGGREEKEEDIMEGKRGILCVCGGTDMKGGSRSAAAK